MEHFVAYHSVRTMGYQFEPTGELSFFSRKAGLLNKAVGHTVWVIQGVPTGKGTAYSLHGQYVADRVEIEDPASGLYAISGAVVKEFVPPVELNGFSWFPALLRSQSNFSLGFNRINDDAVVQSLAALASSGAALSVDALPDLDLPVAGIEGTARLVTHLRRERNRSIVEAKKAATISATGRLCCEACGFDFPEAYGPLGEGFCEVHHVVPLSATSDSVVTRLDDLVILCSNCHRMVHRSNPMLSISQLAELVRGVRP